MFMLTLSMVLEKWFLPLTPVSTSSSWWFLSLTPISGISARATRMHHSMDTSTATHMHNTTDTNERTCAKQHAARTQRNEQSKQGDKRNIPASTGVFCILKPTLRFCDRYCRASEQASKQAAHRAPQATARTHSKNSTSNEQDANKHATNSKLSKCQG